MTIHIGAGTFSEAIILSNIAAFLTIEGTLTELETISSAAVAEGGAATQGTVTKSNAFVGDDYAGKLVYFVTDDAYKIVDTKSSSVLTLVGTAPSSTAQDVIIYDWGTTLQNIDVRSQPNVSIQKVSFSYAGNGLNISGSDNNTVRYCEFDCTVTVSTAALLQMRECVFSTSIDQAVIAYQGCSMLIYGSKLKTSGGYALTVFRNGFVNVRSGTILEATSYGITAADGGRALFYNSNSRCIVRNCTTGLRAYNGSQITGTYITTFSGNSTNKNATASNYGYID